MIYRLNFNGIVQGIGFRPAAQRIAAELRINGFVKNCGGSVEITACAGKRALDEFVRRLVCMFEIKSYNLKKEENGEAEKEFKEFKIIRSEKNNATPFITPDLATCADCEKELFDSKNKRFHHPFISCVNCGPRYTIIKTLPYDRENTVMSAFDMCSGCRKEYVSLKDRRCHAQTIACNDCGPETGIKISEAADTLKSGRVVAVKDIGGYHLACMAQNSTAVKKIREIKGRETKPFAVMFKSVKQAEEYCFLNDDEKKLLTSAARPIVLLKKKRDLPPEVCADSLYIGAFLPCNPIQLLLLDEASPLVMTSANISSEPIITDDGEIKKFGVKILSHDREILTPLDDSVMQVIGSKSLFLRRARGYVPLAIEIDKTAETDTLCLGGDLKAAFAFHSGKYIFMSQYFGDLENADVLAAYKSNINRFKELHSFETGKIVCDLHPAYYSSNIFNADKKIQHHKAHIASVIAEHKLKCNVLGFAFDGTGYGDDGAIWGSEAILYKDGVFNRAQHLDYVEMPASDEISKNADFALACYLGGNALIDAAVKNNINTVKSSSMGRLFDAVCALLDIKHYNSYEGECACALEACAAKAENAFSLTVSQSPTDILLQIKTAYENGESKEALALGFHIMLCRLILETSKKYRTLYGINTVALSGGVFNNRILLKNTFKLLENDGFDVYTNELVPCGDGGIALGQAYISALEE